MPKIFSNMENYKLKLIDGTFAIEDAKKMLYNVINSKINHHKLDYFSNSIRFSQNDNTSGKRILELEKTLLELEKILTLALENDLKINIKSDIQITLTK